METNSEQLNLNPKRIYNNASGWMKDGDTYSPIPSHALTLEAGIYFIQVLEGALGFTKTEIQSDPIFEIADSTQEKIIASIESFWSKAEQLKKGGIYKRGFLFHGKPGCGKTTLLNQICNHLIKQDGIAIVATEPNLTIEALTQLRRIEPDRKIAVLFEDFEGYLNGFGEENLLSLFDGQRQIDNVVYLCTTNYLQDIPDRFAKRPRRIDEVIAIEPPTETARILFINGLCKSYDKDIWDWQKPKSNWITDTEGMPLAHIKELFIAVAILGYGYKETLSRMKENLVESDTDGSGVYGKE